MADDGGEGGGDREGKELVEEVVAVAVPIIVVSKKKLLVLDVNGLLVATYYKQETLPPEPHHVKLGNFYVYKRPFCEEFIRFCLENFIVGIWSSAQVFNVNNLVEFVFKDLRHQLAFSWHQTHCTRTGVKHPDNKHKPVFLKELSRLWATFKPGEYGPSNCLLVDDSPYKALKNPPNTAIFPQTYTAHEHDDNFLGGTLRQYLEGLRDSVDVQAYVEKNPIGEPSITAASPLWQVYGCITSTDQPELVNGGANWASNLKLAGAAIVAHESSRNSNQKPVSNSIPGYQVEESYSCEGRTHSPRAVERLSKRPKHACNRETDAYSSERWGHSPGTLDDGRWSKQPQSELDKEPQGVGWDHFEENYNALNTSLPHGGGSQFGQEAGQVSWDRAHHPGGEFFQPKSLVGTRGLHHTEDNRGRNASTVPLMPRGEPQVDREGDQVRWDKAKHHGGEFYRYKRSIETREERRNQDAPQGRGWRHHFDLDSGPLKQPSPPYTNHRDSMNHTLFQWRRERDLTSEHRSVCSSGQYEQHASVTSLPSHQWCSGASTPMDQQEVGCGRVDLTGEQQSIDSWRFCANEHQIDGGVIWGGVSMEEQVWNGWAHCSVENRGTSGMVWGNPSVDDSWDQVQDSWTNLTVDTSGCGGSWGYASTQGRVQGGWSSAAVENRGGGGSWANSCSEEQVKEQDGWARANFTTPTRGGGGTWANSSSREQVKEQDGWARANFTMTTMGGGGTWANSSSEEQVKEQDGWARASFTTSRRGDGASWLDPTSENRVNNWANLANDRFGTQHGSAYASEQDIIGYRNSHYRYESRPGTNYPPRNDYRHESRLHFATQK